MSDIIVAQPVDPDIVESLRSYGSVHMHKGPEPLSPRALKEHCTSATALMAFMTECIDEDFLAGCENLRVIAGALKGFDNIDVRACSARGVAVTIVPDLLTEPTAELALGLMIAVSRNMRSADTYVRSGSFAGWRPHYFGGSIFGATIGVVGAGRVGQAILRLLTGFRCESLYCDKNRLSPDEEASLRASFASLEEVTERADFLVLALPLTEETMGIVDADFIARMKAGSYLINPARGSLVQEAAVADALNGGHLAGFASDVFEVEDWARGDRPARIDPVLLESERTYLTPHIGSAVTTVRREIARSAADSIKAVLSGTIPRTAVNGGEI